MTPPGRKTRCQALHFNPITLFPFDFGHSKLQPNYGELGSIFSCKSYLIFFFFVIFVARSILVGVIVAFDYFWLEIKLVLDLFSWTFNLFSNIYGNLNLLFIKIISIFDLFWSKIITNCDFGSSNIWEATLKRIFIGWWPLPWMWLGLTMKVGLTTAVGCGRRRNEISVLICKGNIVLL